jgi:SH3-like domain-containing protein
MRFSGLAVCAVVLFSSFAAKATDDINTGSVTGFPIPRFVSLKPSDTPMREGPGKDHHIKWIFKRAGMPVEVTAEFDNWRRVRDSEGAEGWIYHSRLSGKRTAMVQSKSRQPEALFQSPDAEASVVAVLEQGVIAQISGCSEGWCRIHGTGFDGYVTQDRLWGVYPDETIDE